MTRQWMVWDNRDGRGWWNQNRHGHTRDIRAAGRFPEDVARRIVGGVDATNDGIPDKIMMLEPTGLLPEPPTAALDPAAVMLTLAKHRRGPNGSELVGDAPPTHPLMWAVCTCTWTSPRYGVVLNSQMTDPMLTVLDEDHELHLAHELTAATNTREATAVMLRAAFRAATSDREQPLRGIVRLADEMGIAL